MSTCDTCALCGANQSSILYVAVDRHYGIPGSFTIVQCRRCGLVYLSPMPNEQQLSKYYPEDFYAYQPFEVRNRLLHDFIKKLLLYTHNTKDPQFLTPGNLLDIGCGSGEFMDAYRGLGWNVSGVELNSTAADYGRSVHNLNIYAGSLLQAHFPDASFDYVRSNHSLEHIPNPNETFEEIRRVIKGSGRLHIGVPNIDSAMARLFGRYWWYLGAPVHTFNYCADTLVKMAEKHGFIMETIKYNSDYGGSVGSLQIFCNRKTMRKSSEGIFINSAAARVVGQWIAKITDLFHCGDVIEITFKVA